MWSTSNVTFCSIDITTYYVENYYKTTPKLLQAKSQKTLKYRAFLGFPAFVSLFCVALESYAMRAFPPHTPPCLLNPAPLASQSRAAPYPPGVAGPVPLIPLTACRDCVPWLRRRNKLLPQQVQSSLHSTQSCRCAGSLSL